MKPINALWADTLSRHLHHLRMTRSEFAGLMGVSEAAVYKWLRGGTATLDNLSRAAVIFKVHPARLLGGASVNKGAINIWYDALHKESRK